MAHAFNVRGFQQQREQLQEAFGPPPTFPDPPEFQRTAQFQPPAFDRGRVRFLTQQAAAPGLQRLRGGLLRALQGARLSENPNVTGQISRQALAGFGEGIGNVLGAAGMRGLQQFEQERAPEVFRAQAEFQEDVFRDRANFEALLEQQRRDFETSLQQRNLLNQQAFSQSTTRPTNRVISAPRPQLGSTFQEPFKPILAPEGLPGISDAEALASLGGGGISDVRTTIASIRGGQNVDLTGGFQPAPSSFSSQRTFNRTRPTLGDFSVRGF